MCTAHNCTLHVIFITSCWQVRWDATAGFHVPELLKKECTSLEEALQVRAGCR